MDDAAGKQTLGPTQDGGANLDKPKIRRESLEERIDYHLKACAICCCCCRRCCCRRRHWSYRDLLLSRYRGSCEQAGQKGRGHAAELSIQMTPIELQKATDKRSVLLCCGDINQILFRRRWPV